MSDGRRARSRIVLAGYCGLAAIAAFWGAARPSGGSGVPSPSPPVADVVELPPVPIRVRATPRLRLVDASAADAGAVARAIDRFHRNGLLLPDLEIRFVDDRAACRGHYGLFQPRDELWRILICSDVDFVITHELAHAWTRAHLDGAARRRYLLARSLTSWNDPATPWMERGMEDAAFVIQQNLMASNPPVHTERWQRHMAAYELLTGQRSPVRPPDEPRVRRRRPDARSGIDLAPDEPPALGVGGSSPT